MEQVNGKISRPNGEVKKLDRKIPDEEDYTEQVKVDNTDLIIPKTVGLFGGISFIVGTIIGGGIFISPSGVALNTGSVGMTVFTWFLCGMITLLGALCYAELGTIVKSSGGDYSYIDQAFGSLASFQYSWLYNFLVKPGNQAAMALTFAEYTTSPFFSDGCGSAPEIIKRLLATLIILILGTINIYSSRLANRIQIIFATTKVAALFVVIGGGFVKLFQGYTDNLRTGFEGTNTHVGSLVTGFYSGIWAYDGWNTANFVVEEMINVEKNLPLSIIIGVPIVIFIYVMINVSYFTLLNLDQMAKSPAVAMTWAKIMIPEYSWVISVIVAMCCFGTCNGHLFSGSRLINTAARNDHLPNVLSMIHVKSYTPVTAVMCNVCVAIVITFTGTMSTLIDSLCFLMLLSYGLNFGAVIMFRFKANYKDLPRPIKVPIVIPIFCLSITSCLVIIPLVVSPQMGYFYAMAFVAIGYVFYTIFIHFQVKLPCMDKLTEFFQMFLQIFKPL